MPPSIRGPVPSSPEPPAEPPPPRDSAWARWYAAAATVVVALFIAYAGVEVWRAGLSRLGNQPGKGEPVQPLVGYFLVGLGAAMMFGLPLLLLVLTVRRIAKRR